MNKLKSVRMLLGVLCALTAGCASAGAMGDAAIAPIQATTQPTGEPVGTLLLLGTSGGPIARGDRSGIATLLTLAGKEYLIDAGEGLVHQLGKVGKQAPDLPIIFLTHLHDDHYAGLPALGSFAWTLRSPRIDIYGPAGTADLGEGLRQVMLPNARIRMAEQRIATKLQDFVVTHEYAAGRIFDDGKVRVSAVVNSHYDLPPGSPAAGNLSYALRFDGGGRSIVFTGDTGPSAAVVELAKGADVLVSEMASHADREAVPPFVRAHMDKEHLSPLEVGKLAAAAGVTTLVLTHIGVVGQSDVAVIRSVFSGKIIVGSDMLRTPF